MQGKLSRKLPLDQSTLTGGQLAYPPGMLHDRAATVAMPLPTRCRCGDSREESAWVACLHRTKENPEGYTVLAVAENRQSIELIQVPHACCQIVTEFSSRSLPNSMLQRRFALGVK